MSTASPDKGHQRPTRWLRWFLLVFAWFIVPLLILAGLELGLRAAGYGMDTAPFQVLNTDRGRVYLCDRENLYHLFSHPVDIEKTKVEFAIPERKEPGTYRIFVFGSSAAAGWIHSASFSQLLQVMLMERFPGVRFEVYNLANAGLNSSIMRPLAQDCARMHPDAYVIYMGNNEVHGPYGLVTEYMAREGRVMTPLEIRLHQGMRRFRLGQWLDRAARKDPISENQGIPKDVSPEDPRLSQIWRNYEYNLRDMFHAAAGAGAEVFVSTLGANLRHWPPQPDLIWDALSEDKQREFENNLHTGKSLEEGGQWEEALHLYGNTETITESSPYLFFRQATCRWALGDHERARALYDKALERDSFTWVRAKHAFNATIRKAVNGHEGFNVVLVDGQAALEAAAPHATPGNESFADGCHLRPSGMYVLARAFYEQMCPKMPYWVRQHEDKDAPMPELSDILALLGFSESLNELTLEMLIQKSREYSMDCTHALQTELDHIRAHPVLIDLARQFSLLREVIEAGTEDVQIAYKFVQCSKCLAYPMDEEIEGLLCKLAERYAFDPSFQYQYSEILRFNDKNNELEILFKKLVEHFPGDERAYLHLTPLLLSRGALEEARQLLTQARRRNLPESVCQCMLGDIVRHEGNAAAITAYMRSLHEDKKYYSFVLEGLNEVLKRFPEEAAAQAVPLRELVDALHDNYKDWKLARILEALPGDQPTVELYLKIADQSPAPDLWSILQQIDVLLDGWNCRTLFWREQTGAHPESALRRVCLGLSLEREGNLAEAAQVYLQTLELVPEYIPSMFKLGLLEIGSDNPEQGIEHLIQAAKNNVAIAVFIAGECSKKASVFEDQGNLDAAITLYTAALQVSPTDLWPQVHLGELYERQGKYDAALNAYRTVLLKKPESPVSAQKLQDLLVKMQTPPEILLTEWQAISNTHPEAAVPLQYMGMALESLGRIDDARAAYKKTLNQNPELDHAACRLAALEVLAGNIDQGLAEMREIARKHPDQISDISKRLGGIAKTFMGQGKTEEAILLYTTALELSPTDLWPQVYLGEIYEARGDYDKALEAYRSVLTQKPESPVSARKMQDLLVKIQTPPETVLGLWRAISEQHPEAAVPLYYLGMALEAAGDLKGAEEAVHRSMGINPDIAATAPLRDAATGPHASEAPKNR